MNYICIRDRAVLEALKYSAMEDRRDLSAQAEYILHEYTNARYGVLPPRGRSELGFNGDLEQTTSVRKFDDCLARYLADGVSEVEPWQMASDAGVNLIMLGRIAKAKRIYKVHRRTVEGQRWFYQLSEGGGTEHPVSRQGSAGHDQAVSDYISKIIQEGVLFATPRRISGATGIPRVLLGRIAKARGMGTVIRDGDHGPERFYNLSSWGGGTE